MTQTEEKITFEQMPQLLAELKGAIIVRITISPPHLSAIGRSTLL